MALGDVAHASWYVQTLRRTLGTKIEHIDGIGTGQEEFASPLNVRETVVGILVAHHKAHQTEQIGRVDPLAGRVPSRQMMLDIRPNPMKRCTFSHNCCKITKKLAYMQKKV